MKRRRLTLHNKCFRCIHDTPFDHSWEFVWECANEVMDKMSIDELNELAQEVLDFVKKNYPFDYDIPTTILVGDSYARVYTYTITKGNYLRGAYQKIEAVRDMLAIASVDSIPAWGVCSMFSEDQLPLPQCWVDRTQCRW